MPPILFSCRIGDRVPTIDYAEPSQKDQQGGGGGGGGASGGGMRNVFVGNLQPGATEETLRSLFAHYGEVGWGGVAGSGDKAEVAGLSTWAALLARQAEGAGLGAHDCTDQIP